MKLNIMIILHILTNKKSLLSPVVILYKIPQNHVQKNFITMLLE